MVDCTHTHTQSTHMGSMGVSDVLSVMNSLRWREGDMFPFPFTVRSSQRNELYVN